MTTTAARLGYSMRPAVLLNLQSAQTLLHIDHVSDLDGILYLTLHLRADPRS